MKNSKLPSPLSQNLSSIPGCLSTGRNKFAKTLRLESEQAGAVGLEVVRSGSAGRGILALVEESEIAWVDFLYS